MGEALVQREMEGGRFEPERQTSARNAGVAGLTKVPRPPKHWRELRTRWHAVAECTRFFAWRGGYPEGPRLVRVLEPHPYVALVPAAPALSYDGKTWVAAL